MTAILTLPHCVKTNFIHISLQDGQNGSANESPENLELEDIEEEKTFTLSNLTPGQFCIKMLCENEKVSSWIIVL